MLSSEADLMIDHLAKTLGINTSEQKMANDKQRKRIISACYSLPEKFGLWHTDGDRKIFNADGLDNHLTSVKSPVKKKLNDCSTEELSTLIFIFEKMSKQYSQNG